LYSVIAWSRLQGPAGRRGQARAVNSTLAQLNALLNSAHSLKLFYFIS